MKVQTRSLLCFNIFESLLHWIPWNYVVHVGISNTQPIEMILNDGMIYEIMLVHQNYKFQNEASNYKYIKKIIHFKWHDESSFCFHPHIWSSHKVAYEPPKTIYLSVWCFMEKKIQAKFRHTPNLHMLHGPLGKLKKIAWSKDLKVMLTNKCNFITKYRQLENVGARLCKCLLDSSPHVG